MASQTRHGSTRTLRGSLMGVCAAWLLAGCGPFDRELLEDLFDGRGQGHGGHHGGGHHGGGGGGGDDPAGIPCSQFVSGDDLFALIANDLRTLDADDQPFTRYLTLANQANADGCGEALAAPRAALDKLVNSLSSEPTLTALVPIDVDLTTYRLDIRSYGWDRAVRLGGTVFPDGWEAIIASSVYAVPHEGDDADDAKADTGTAVPVLLGDAFVAAAASAPLYYALLDVPEDIDAFLSSGLGIDVAADRADGNVVRAGIGGTGVGIAEFLSERFGIQVRAGGVWQMFSGQGGADALLSDPLGTPASQERELVFTLQNGLLGHALASGDGQRLDASSLTLDTNQNDFQARIAASYFQLRARGVAPTDEIREFALGDPDAFSPDELARILAQYPAGDDLDAIALADRNAVDAALSQIGLGTDDSPEPISFAFLQFDRDVDLETAAGALFVSPEDLEDNLNLLQPALGVLRNGSIDRNDFDQFYLDSLCISSVVNENTPPADLCAAAAEALSP